MNYLMYRIRLYPTKEQSVLIDNTIGCSRFLFNKMLSERNEIYKQLKNNIELLRSYKYKTERQYKEEFPFLQDVSSRALQQASRDLNNTYRNFFKKLKTKKLGRRKDGQLKGFPKFKKKSTDRWSYREPQCNGNQIRIKDRSIWLLKLGYVNFAGLDKNFNGRILFVTIIKERTGKYYASICVTQSALVQKKRTSDNISGLDLGLKEFVTISDGNSAEFIKGIHKQLNSFDKRISKAQKYLSRKTYGSNRYEKQREKLNRIYIKRKNIQNHFQWHLANYICGKNKVAIIEKLNVENMKKNRRLSRAIQNVSWSSFIWKLKFKAKEYETEIYEVDRFFPSSKLCNNCGTIKEDLKLYDRKYICDCGYEQDRDVNAALNLRNEYLKKVSAESVDYGHGELIRPKRVAFDLKGEFYEVSTENLNEKSITENTNSSLSFKMTI